MTSLRQRVPAGGAGSRGWERRWAGLKQLCLSSTPDAFKQRPWGRGRKADAVPAPGRRHARLPTCASGVFASRAPAFRAFEGHDADRATVPSVPPTGLQGAGLRPRAGTPAPPPPRAQAGRGLRASDNRGLLPAPPAALAPPSRCYSFLCLLFPAPPPLRRDTGLCPSVLRGLPGARRQRTGALN